MFEWQEDFESGQLKAQAPNNDEYWICGADLVHVTFDSAGVNENWLRTGREEDLKKEAVAHHKNIRKKDNLQ